MFTSLLIAAAAVEASTPSGIGSWIQTGGTVGVIAVLIWVVHRLDKTIAATQAELNRLREEEYKRLAEDKVREFERWDAQLTRREVLTQDVTEALRSNSVVNATTASAFRHMRAAIVQALGEVQHKTPKQIAAEVAEALDDKTLNPGKKPKESD